MSQELTEEEYTSLFHNNDVKDLAKFLFSKDEEEPASILMLLFKGASPNFQDWINTLIFLRTFCESFKNQQNMILIIQKINAYVNKCAEKNRPY